MFDESGDQFDCRIKTAHQQGSIGKAEWVSLGNHSYTGIFEYGADTGFVRLSPQDLVLKPEETQDGALPGMKATIAVKFLRDHIDSANAVANGPAQFGSYDFFENSLKSNTSSGSSDDLEALKQVNFFQRIRPSTAFISSVGHSDFATFDQCGTEFSQPVTPYSLRYEPNPALSYSDPYYTRTFHEHLSEIAPGTLLYTVHAQDRPKS